MTENPLENFLSQLETTPLVSEYLLFYFDNISDDYYSPIIEKNSIWFTNQLQSVSTLIEIVNPLLQDDLMYLEKYKDLLIEMIDKN